MSLSMLPQSVVAAVESTPIPPLPQVLLQLLQAVEDDNASLSSLSTLISRDAVLSARILAASNSAAFWRGKKILRIGDCVNVLGTRIVRSMATCLAVQHAFDPLSRGLKVDLADFWRHSLLVAETARILAVESRTSLAEEAYLAGLLHDLGELMLLVGMPDYAGLLSICSDEANLADLENEVMGTDHAAVGAWLVDQWKLDSLMADAILFHHRSESEIAAADPLSQLLWTAHTWVATGTLPENSELLTGIPAATLAPRLQQAEVNVDKIASALGLTEPTVDLDLDLDLDPVPKRPFPIVIANAPKTAPKSGTDAGLEAAVRDLALMQPLQRSLGALESDSEILFSLRESVRILFGIDRLAFLMFDAGKASFSGAADGSHPALLQQLVIPLDNTNSLVAMAAQGGAPCASFEQASATLTASSSLADIQLMRGLGADGLICVPMRTGKQLLGVMVIGLTQAQFARMDARTSWLTGFARLAAGTLEAWQETRENKARIESAVIGRFERKEYRVIHEAGNPLGIIRNYLTLLERKLPTPNALNDELKIIGEEIDRVTRIVEGLVEVPLEPDSRDLAEAGDLNALVLDMLSLYENALFKPRDIVVDLSLVPGRADFVGDPNSAKQILLNLCKNAAEAMPQGGRLTISTACNVIERGRQHSELSVSDNGPGLPVEVQQRLAQRPGDQPSGRRGIGLSVVSDLVSRLGGNLIVRTRSGEGTRFCVLIPAVAAHSREE